MTDDQSPKQRTVESRFLFYNSLKILLCLQVAANNGAGKSEYSEQMQFSTMLDVSQLPAPEHVQFERQARQVDFHVVRSDIEVVGALEVRSVYSL